MGYLLCTSHFNVSLMYVTSCNVLFRCCAVVSPTVFIFLFPKNIALSLQTFTSAVSPPFWAPGTHCLEDDFSKDQGWGRWFQDDSSTLHLLCTLFLM